MGGTTNRRGWPQEPTPEERAEGERRRAVGQAAAALAVELTGCVAGSDNHIDVTRRLLRFARLVEASMKPGLARKASCRRMTADDAPAALGEVIEQVLGRIALGLPPDDRREG